MRTHLAGLPSTDNAIDVKDFEKGVEMSRKTTYTSLKTMCWS